MAANRQHSAEGFPASSWHHWAKQWDSLATQWVMKWLPKLTSLPRLLSFFLPVFFFSLSLALLPEYSTSTESFPCSQHRGADAGWKAFRFSFISMRKWACSRHQGLWLSATEKRYGSQHFHFARHKHAPLHSTPPAQVASSYAVNYQAQLLPTKKKGNG